MANIASSKKDARRSAARAQRNRAVKSAVKTKVAKFRRGVAEKAHDAAELALVASSALDRAASKGVLHRNNAARRKSRVARRLNALRGAAPAAAAPARATRQAKAARPATPAAKAATKTAPAKSAARGSTAAKPATKTSKPAKK